MIDIVYDSACALFFSVFIYLNCFIVH